MLEQLRKRPKGKPGRPKGAKALPKTLEELMVAAIKEPDRISPKIRPKRKYVKTSPIHATMLVPKEVKAERCRKMLAKRSRAGRRVGQGQVTTLYEFAQQKQFARNLAHKVFKIMEVEGSLPENPIAKQAMKEALVLLAEQNSTKDRLAIIRTLLEYNLAKPAATQNVNLKTAEDFLDELAGKA
jgi:hypothetical protein